GIHELINSCTKLTHLSLTGVVCFLRKDLTRFCRPPPNEFNEHQRAVFCVFSGPGVAKLRNHLNHLSHTNGNLAPDQAYYDDREEQDTPLVDEEDDEDEEEEIQEE
ncbi:SCF ubiquitin ligase complex subunit, partial [Orbilia oligospora]